MPWLAAVAAWLVALVAAGSAVAQVRAGTAVVNVAEARADVGGSVVIVASNTDRLLVAERLDVALERTGTVATPPGTDLAAIPVLLIHRGNGREAFTLSLAATDGVSLGGAAIDADGDGLYDPARDTLLTDGTVPPVEPGGSVPLLILAGGAAGTVTLVARADTGSGAPGTVFAGAGDGGADAVTGPTGAEARLAIPLEGAASPELHKAQSVRAPDGTGRPVPGAIVTYTLQAVFPQARRAARIDDALPDGTRYLPGTLSLDGAALTDAAGDDAGSFDGSAVAVALGDIAAPATRTVTFQAILQ